MLQLHFLYKVFNFIYSNTYTPILLQENVLHLLDRRPWNSLLYVMVWGGGGL